MIDIVTHIQTECPACKTRFNHLVPSNQIGAEALKDYKPYQPLRSKITAIKGAEKLRSVAQLRLYWAVCKFTADNIPEDPKYRYWQNKDAVDFQLRVALDFRDTSMLAVRADGEVVFMYKSIALANLKHLAACDYFSRAFELMAKVLGMDKDKLIEATQATMQSY